MDTLKIAFFWHMHQPCYKDAITNEFVLPWVRLHSIREYYDMISILERFPDINQTFNMVPSLVSQILEYSNHEVSDLYLSYTLKQASELSSEDRKFILKNFFMCNWTTMIKSYPRYWSLLKKRGMKNLSDKELARADILFSTQDYLDIQVWFNLSWFGYFALSARPELVELKKKGRDFTEDDKRSVIDAQFDIIKRVIPAYKNALDSGRIELSTSPFYHPILPLLHDTELAKRNMADGTVLPDRQLYPEDAQAQIIKGIDLHEKVFGERPVGLWPPEGSVAPELIPMLRNNGIQWIAADEEILFKSLPQDIKGNQLYRPYTAVYEGEKIDIVFRDKELSEFIGFIYAGTPPEKSVDDFFNRLHSIRRYTISKGEAPVVFIILDGENPWEHYEGGGERFLHLLYERLSHDSAFETVKIGEYLETHPPVTQIDDLYTGSWIGHNFNVWIGQEEDNKAWNHIKKTRSFLQNFLNIHKDINDDIVNSAWNEIYISEASDWFWWYGDDFLSNTFEEFDRLFRSHLKKVYKLLGMDIPGDLKIPIKNMYEEHTLIKPTAFISPKIDGVETDYFEWLGAGKFSLTGYERPFLEGKGCFSKIFYGFNEDMLFIRIDPVKKRETFLSEEFDIYLQIFHNLEYRILFNCNPDAANLSYELYVSSDGALFEKKKEIDTIGIKDVVELSIPFEEIDLKANDEIRFVVELIKGNVEVDRFPRYRVISCMVPGKDFEELMWSAL